MNSITIQDPKYYILTRIFQFLVKVRASMAGDAERYYVYLALLVSGSVEARRSNISYDDPEWHALPVSALSISDMTGIPRQTVRRKLEALEKAGLVMSLADGSFILAQREPDIDIVNEISRYKDAIK